MTNVQEPDSTGSQELFSYCLQSCLAMKIYAKKKFGPKVMLWIAMSTKGMSTPVLASGRSMAVTGRSYIDSCLEPHLVPLLNTHYPHGGYIVFSDKASTHYARIATDFLDKNNFSYVKKANNSTEVPLCRPIKEFSGYWQPVFTTKIG